MVTVHVSMLLLEMCVGKRVWFKYQVKQRHTHLCNEVYLKIQVFITIVAFVKFITGFSSSYNFLFTEL